MVDDQSSRLGTIVDKYRREAGLTKRGLAERAGLSPGYVNLVLNNQKTSPSARVVLALADALRLEAQKREGLLLAAGLDPHAISEAMAWTDENSGQLRKGDDQNRSSVSIGGIVRVYPELDDRILIQRMAKASTIWILDTFFPDLRRRLKDVLIARSNGGATIRVLLIDPNSPFARKRSKDISEHNPESYVPIQVRFTRDDVVRLREDGVNIEIKFYRSLPSSTQYMCDDSILFGILAHGERSDFTPQLEVQGENSTMYKFLKSEFDNLWEEAIEESKISFDVIKDD
jgi:transcriptional regulator with XRE-family HTH domain